MFLGCTPQVCLKPVSFALIYHFCCLKHLLTNVCTKYDCMCIIPYLHSKYATHSNNTEDVKDSRAHNGPDTNVALGNEHSCSTREEKHSDITYNSQHTDFRCKRSS